MKNANEQSSQKGPPEIVNMFQKSFESKESMALHPHLYSGLYLRASEIKALDKIVGQLHEISSEIKAHNYTNLPPLLEAIKDALNGTPHLSWWNLFTVSLGHALDSSTEDEKNDEEKKSLTLIAEILTEIIRYYGSSDTRLLLEIRLTALDVESRLVELIKIPENLGEEGETLDYLASEFKLLNEELRRFKNSDKENWSQDSKNLLHCITKANQLMRVLENIRETNIATYEKFLQLNYFNDLSESVATLLRHSTLLSSQDTPSFWKTPQIESLFELFSHFPESILEIKITEMVTLLKEVERAFIEDMTYDKKRPAIFSFLELKIYATHCNAEFIKQNEHLKAVIKGTKIDQLIKRNLVAYFKKRFTEENDLHHICSMIRFKNRDYEEASHLKQPAVIQRELLSRMIVLANMSQPRDLDEVLKSFTDEEKEKRYYFLQEVILEQFIRWRKQGIY